MPQNPLSTRCNALVIGLAVLTLLLVGVGPAAADDSPPLSPIDDDHTFDCSELAMQGVTGSNHTVPAVSFTLANQPSQVGLAEDWTDAKTNDYLRVSYEEDRTRVLRLWIPTACASPYVKEPVSPVAGGPPAEYSIARANGTRYLQVKLTVTGRTDAVYPISVSGGMSFNILHRATERVQEVVGGGSDESSGPSWTYIDRSRLQGANATATVTFGPNATDPLFQYRTGNETWAIVPDEASHPAPLYRMRKSGVNKTVFVVSEPDSPPQVRYVNRTNTETTTKGILHDVNNALSNMWADVQAIFDDLSSAVGLTVGTPGVAV